MARIKMTWTTRVVLFCLQIYIAVMLVLILVKFLRGL
jgi:hypothetical protein